ncbi:uncharacterized protein [Pyrus communis]|uniref:uncharacterized protein isoform X2 n=1 Tax=Pyrus communis TaxID=23211 RepID=UPI0035C07E53
MSGGFFRGTSADQDTRFSNKQAKLMKSQKFAPELEHLVDITKVSMDVMRPWIANRVTELLGFEDEVLINFIYGLLEGKVVNGKEIQISLTGFMEKNTVKFMKELWTLLISAQNNASGVPQQFLDAKQEEARKKKEEADKFASDIQRKKEKERIDQQEILKKMEEGADKKANSAALEPSTKRMSPRDSNDHYEDERGAEKRIGVKARSKVSRSPNSENSSLSPRERHRSRSISKSPKALRRSISSDRSDRSSPRRPITTVRRHSPEGSTSPRGRSRYSRQRSRSNSQQRSPSPYRRRVRSPYWRRPSPVRRRRSPSPVRRRRSPSPVRRRRSPSPVRRHRSPSPVRRRRSPSPVRRRRSPSPIRRPRSPSPVRRPRSPSPVRRPRSPSPVRRRRSPSPLRRRRSPSPLRRRRSRSPVRRRSPSPVRRAYRRSPLNTRNRYVSPLQHRSPVRSRRSPTPPHRSPSPHDRSSSPIQHGSPSPIRRTSKLQRSPSQSPQERTRSREKISPVPHRSSSYGSLQRELKNGNDSRKRAPDLSPSPVRSRLLSESPPGVRSDSEERRRLSSPDEIPVRQPREQMTHDVSSSPPRKPREQQLHRGSPDISEDKLIASPAKVRNKEEYSRNRLDNKDFRNKEHEMKSGKSSGRVVPESPDQQQAPTIYKDSLRGEMQNPDEGRKSDEKNHSHSKNSKDSDRHCKSGSVHSSIEKVDHSNRSGIVDSGSEESEKCRGAEKGKRKNKRSERQEVTSDDDYSNDSEIDERKNAKRRRKEEKRSRKEKKRRRREERRRRKEERRAEKMKGKNYSDASASDGEHVGRRKLHSSDNEEKEDVQKKLEIELRKKALESLKAKKGISH